MLAVMQDSAAEKSGLKPGDYVVELDGQPLSTINELEQRLSQSDATEPPTLRISRGDEELQLQLVQD